MKHKTPQGATPRDRAADTGPNQIIRSALSRLLASALAAGTLVATIPSASAVSVLPGDTKILKGITSAEDENLAGLVIKDTLHPFEIRDGRTLIIAGVIQDRVALSDKLGTLNFSYFLRDLSGLEKARIIRVVRTGFAGVTTDVNYRTDGLGDIGANSVTRSSGTGDQLSFRYDPNIIDPPDESLFTFALTDAEYADFTGSIRIYARTSALGPEFSVLVKGMAVPGDLEVEPGGMIQPAINMANPGDAVMVPPGTYNESLILRSAVDVIGAGPGQTILEPSFGAGVTATDITDTEFSGFTIQPAPGSTSTRGVHIDGGNPAFIGNHVAGFPEEGIRVVSGSTAFICGNRLEANFDPNNSRLDYNLIILQATPLVTNNLIIRGECGCYIGWHASDGMRFVNNTVADNSADGVWCYQSNPVIKNNLVTGNSPGISASFANATPILTYNNSWGNQGFGNYSAQQTGVINIGIGSISEDPLYDPFAPDDYLLSEDSPCIDAGDPAAIHNDLDGSRNDIGYTGGPCGSSVPPGTIVSGFVWTSVGTYATADIDQTTGDKRGLTHHRDRPFGGSPWLYGAFGTSETSIYRYAVLIGKWTGATPPNAGDFEYLDDPLSKVRYDISGGTLATSRVSLGPIVWNGRPTYGLTVNSGNIFWAHENLRMVFNTVGLEEGTYSVRMEPLNTLGNPISLTVNHDLILTVNNTRPVVSIDSISYNGSPPFSECTIIRLPSNTATLDFVYTAHHPDGYLDEYNLQVLVGRNRSGGFIVTDDYAAHTSSTGNWSGVTMEPVAATPVWPPQPLQALQPWETCAYQFRLRAWARTTNGFNRLYWRTFFDTYAIDTDPPVMCGPDLDGDGDVDADDLAILAAAYGTAPNP